MEDLGPSGFEREANAICKAYMEPYADEVFVDRLGSVRARPHRDRISLRDTSLEKLCLGLCMKTIPSLLIVA